MGQPDAVDEGPHILFDLGGQELVESSGAEFVNELLDELLVLRHSESKMDIDIDVCIVLGWAPLDRSIVVNDVLGEHTGNSLPEAVAPLSSRSHHTR